MNQFSHVQVLFDLNTSSGGSRREGKRILEAMNKLGVMVQSKFISTDTKLAEICEQHGQCGNIIFLVLVGKFNVPTVRFVPYNCRNDGTVIVFRTPRIGEEGSKIYAKTVSSFLRSVEMLKKVVDYVSKTNYISVYDALAIDVEHVVYAPNEWEKMVKDLIKDGPVDGDKWWLDFETTGLNPREDTICVTGLQGNGPVRVLYSLDSETPHLNVIEHIFMAHPEEGIGAFNAIFEHGWILEKLDLDVKITADGQVTHCMLREEDAHDLGQVACEIGHAGYELEMDDFLKPIPYGKFAVVKKELRNHHHDAPPTLLVPYNAQDVHVCKSANEQMMINIGKNEPAPEREYGVIKWLLRGQSCLSRCHKRGIFVGKRELLDTVSRYSEKASRLLGEIVPFAQKHGAVNFNPGSPVQRSNLLYNVLKLPVMKTTDKDWMMAEDLTFDEEGNCHRWWDEDTNPSTDGDAMEWLYSYLNNPEYNGNVDKSVKGFVKNLMDYNVTTSVANGLLTRCMDSMSTGSRDPRGGTVHSNWSLTKLVTGQISSTNPPMQNVAKLDVRDIFISRFKGGFILEADYSQLHLRIIGNLAQCPGFIDAYASGVDLHIRTTANVLMKIPEKELIKRIGANDEVAVDMRDKGKRVNFSIIFEIGPTSLSMSIQERKEIARGYIKDWFAFFPEIREQIDRQHAFAEKHGYIISPVGRVRHLPGARSPDRSVKSRSLRQAGDFSISNSGRYTTLYGMIMLDEDLIRRKAKSMVIGQVHDSVLVDVHPSEVDLVKELVKVNCVDRVMDEFGEWMDPIPLEMDGFYGPSWWKKGKEVKKFKV